MAGVGRQTLIFQPCVPVPSAAFTVHSFIHAFIGGHNHLFIHIHSFLESTFIQIFFFSLKDTFIFFYYYSFIYWKGHFSSLRAHFIVEHFCPSSLGVRSCGLFDL